MIPCLAIGLMSGTSLDGVDAALLETDGAGWVRPMGALTLCYPSAFRKDLRRALDGDIDPASLEATLTDFHAKAVETLLERLAQSRKSIRIVGFHGQTVLHRPQEGRTWQIGDGQRLANSIGIDVAFDFRSDDVAAGGQGAPLAPIYHAALAEAAPQRPLAFVNIGGVANVTWIDRSARLIACDVGPGNGSVDDWIARHTDQPFDANGRIARTGVVDQSRIDRMLSAAFFQRPPPKSLDRLDFSDALATGLSLADGAATLTELTAAAIAASGALFPAPPARWLISGGGRSNAWLMERLAALIPAPVGPIETLGFKGDDIEAEAFAYLGVRKLLNLPISFPETTGAPRPMPGGRLARARR